MRLLVLAVSLVALSAGSFWALTSGPLAPSAEPTASVPAVPLVTGAATGATAWSSEAVAAGGPSPLAPPTRAIRTTLSHATYPVTGQTEREVLRSLLASGPRDGDDIFFGLTATELDVRFDPKEISGGCVIRNTQVDLDIVITLPEWQPMTDVGPGLQRDWRQFRWALAEHEDEHRALAIEGAEQAYDAVAELYRPSCAEANTEARRRLERIGVEIEAAHRRLDQETGHGKADGAVWPVVREE